jgi:DNA-binding SARP family transcriptional activator
LVVYCLGPFRVYQDDHLITDWESLKAKCILKYLVAHHGAPIVKDVLMDVFWPDAEPEAARRNLHQAVYSLRQTLRQRRPNFPYVWFESDCYLLNPDTSAWLDFEQFEQHYRDGQRLEAAGQLAEAIEKYGIAEGLYEGDFLEEELYEDWPTPQRQRLRTLYLQMADRLSEYYVRHGDLAAAIILCRKILSLDNCCEEAHRRLMACYLAQGQRHMAVRQYHACVQGLREELDLTPSEETMELYHRITTRV